MPDKIAPEERPDWIVNSIMGKTNDVESIYKDNLSIGDFSIAEPDKYWDKEGIRNMFKGQDGKEDRASFDKLYNTEKEAYLKLRQSEFDAVNYKAQFSSDLNEQLGVEINTPEISKVNPDVWGRSFGYDYYDGTGFSDKQHGIREAGVKQGVQVGNGKYVPTDQFDGIIKFAKNEDGSYAMNENGSTYLVPVKDGEELKGTDEVYSGFTNWMGYYGHDYEWKHLGLSIAKNAVGFLGNTMDSLAEFPKAVLTGMYGDDAREMDSFKGIVNFENYWKQANPTMTEEGQAGGFFSAESLTDLGQQVIWQIGAMVLTGGSVGGVSKMLGAGKAAGQIGSTAGRLFMTGLAAGPIADTARDNGLNGREIAGMLAITSAALYPVMMLEEFVAMNKTIGTSHRGIQQALKDALKVVTQKGTVDKAALKTLRPNLMMRIKNLMHEANKLPAVVGGAGGEAVEESVEQVVDLGVRNLYNLYNNVANEEGSDARKKNFQFDWVKEAEALGYAAVGGAMGGAIAGPLMRKFFKQNPDQAYDMYAMVADGKEQRIIDYVNKMKADGRMDYSFKDSKGEFTPEENKTRNEQSSNIVLGAVEYLTKIRDDQQLNNLYKNNKAKASIYRNTLESSSVGKDAAKLFTDINQLDQDISELRKAEGTVNDRDIDEKTRLKDEKQMTLDKIKRGEFVGDYVAEGLYNLNVIARQDDPGKLWNMGVLTGKNFVNLSRTGPTFTEAANEKIKDANVQLDEADRSATAKKWGKVTQKGKERITQEANQQFNNEFDLLKKHLPVINAELEELGQAAISTDDLLNPQTRGNALQVLEGYIDDESVNPDIKATVTTLSETDKRIKAIEETKIDNITSPVDEKDLMTNMVQISETNQMKNTTIPIAQKILEQLAIEKESNRDGVSTYSGVEAMSDILHSVQVRMSQVQANPQIVPKANQMYETNDQEKLRELDTEEQQELMVLLDQMAGESERLLQISLENAASQDKQLRAAAIAKFGKDIERLGEIQIKFSGNTEFKEIGAIISKHLTNLQKALDDGDVEAYFGVQRQMEHDIHTYGHGNRQAILKSYKFAENPSAQEIDGGVFDTQISQFDYMRGVLAEDSNKIWNAYKAIISNMKDTDPTDPTAKALIAASDEQLSAIVSAVQGLSAQKYKTFGVGTHHHNSYYINAIGGSGKTALLAPVIAGIYQKLNGGKIHLSSLMNKGKGINKKINLQNKVIDFFKQGTNTVGIDLVKSPMDILTFVKSAESDGTNLIIFDEVTLLASKQLDELQAALNIKNAARAEAKAEGKNVSPLKILFTGDSNQNSPGQTSESVEHITGMSLKSRHAIAQSDPLTFSFRVQNDQLRMFGDWTRNVQKEIGQARPLTTQYTRSKKKGDTLSSEKGVRVHNSQTDFENEVKRIVDRLKTTKTGESMVYITDKVTEVPSWVPKKIIMTAEESQGEEWDYVFYDPSNKKVFGSGTNLIPKKQFHTAVTRAKQYFVTSLDEPRIKSKEGAVYATIPISPSGTTKNAQLERVRKILGDASSTTETTTNYTYDDFKDEYVPSEPPPEPPPEGPAEGPTEETPTDLGTVQGRTAEFLKTRNRRDEVTMFTFFTVEGQENTKKRALYDKHLKNDVDTSGYKYMLTIAKIGSPEYNNYVNNNPDFNGSYAIFIEGMVDGERAVLGTLPAEDIADYIAENDVLQGQEAISISLGNELMSNSQGFKPVLKWDTSQTRTLGALKAQYGDSITIGSPRVALQDVLQSEKAKEGGQPTAEKGDIVLPISIAYNTSQEVNDSLHNVPQNDFITTSGINKASVPFETILDELNRFRDEKGFLKVKSGDGGKYYETFWSHDTKDRVKDGKRVVGRVVEAINDLHEKIPESDVKYKAFVKGYTRNVDPNNVVDDGGTTTEETDATINTVSAKYGDGRIGASTKASWIIQDYVNALNVGNDARANLFERLLIDLQADEKFKDGFTFNPRTGPHTGANDTHMTAFEGMDDVYDKYLNVTITNVAHPEIQLSKGDLMDALQRGTVNPVVDNDQSESTEGKTSDAQDALKNDGNVTINENATTADPESESLYDFQKRFFDGPLINIFPEAISRFKRTFYSKFFNLGTATIVETDTAITNLKNRFGENAYLKPEDLKALDLINSSQDRDKYIDHVLSKNMNFLLAKYAPTVQNVDGVYKFVSSHHKNRSFGEKESFALLKEGMTEMVATQIENTPIVAPVLDKDGIPTGEYLTTDRYLDIKRDTEEIIDAFKKARNNNHASITSMLKNSDSEVLQSLYVRFYSPDKMIVDGVTTHSLSGFIDPNVFPMVDSLSVFFLSGEIFNLGAVNLNSNKSGIPHNPYWKKPNEIREHGQSVMNRVATDVASGATTMSITRSGSSSIYTIDNDTFIKGSQEQYSTQKLIDGFNAIGMDFVTEAHLDEMMGFYAAQMQLPAAPVTGRTDKRIAPRNKYLMDNVVFPALNKISIGKITFIQGSEMVYSTVARLDGINTSMDTINVGGNRVYRLRNTSPIFHFDRKLADRKDDLRFDRHMFRPDGRYEITDFYLKDGFKWTTENGKVRNTQNNSLSADETLEYDLLWGFADTYTQTRNTSPAFALPITVYSDGGTDVTPIIRSKDPFDTKAIVAELFDSRVAYYTRVEQDVKSRWEAILGKSYKSLAEIQKALSKKKMSIKQAEKVKGLMKNLHYVADKNGNAKLNPILLSDIRIYKTGKLAGFESILEGHLNRLRERVDYLDDKFNLKKRLAERINEDPDEVVKAFYYNWVAASSEVSTLMVGSKNQYKGTNESDQYNDLTKRAKHLISNHSMQIFRDENWEAERQRRMDNDEPLDDKFLNDGMKLSRSYKVAYSTDPRVDLESFAGETKSQEVYDGATFVTPLTRIFQRASNGGKHGTNVSHVMKNIASAINESGTTFIKHAEFEFTSEMMQNGTNRVISAVRGMLNPAFDAPVETFNDKNESVMVGSAWDYLMSLGVKENLTNVKDEHFQELAEFLVDNGLQGFPVMELIPSTSVKTGGGATNNMESDSNLENLVTEQLDILNKGTQLDASKDATKGMLTRATSQLFNVIGLNWRNPEQTAAVYQGLVDLATEVQEDFTKLNDDQLEERLKNLVRVAQDTDNQSLTYQQKLIDTDYSIDDRQMLNRVVSLLNADIVSRGIAPRFQGGQYVVHPANGLIKVYENGDGTVSLKSKRKFTDNDGRDLALHSPAMKRSLSEVTKLLQTEMDEDLAKLQEEFDPNFTPEQALEFEVTQEEIINTFNERLTEYTSRATDDEITIKLTDTNQYKSMIKASKKLDAARKSGDIEKINAGIVKLTEARNKVDLMLQNDSWEGGHAEVILPTEMQKDFFLEENIDLNDIDSLYFKKKIASDREANKMKQLGTKSLTARADKMFEGFQKRLEGLMIRIPTTGKHSALPSRVVAFMNGSDNSVFVPAELLMLQGADQDYDKGSYLTFEAVAGFIPTMTRDENNKPVLDPFFTQAIPKRRTIYVDPNYVTKSLGGRTSNIDTALYKEIQKHTVAPKDGVAIQLDQHAEALKAAIKNDIVDNMRQILADPKNAVEGSISVDNILNELRRIRDSHQSTSKFSQDDYTSYAKMREENQSGVSLTGIFANSGKAYQIAYSVLKSQDINDNEILAGLSNTDGSTMSNTWARFAALTNAAVDGAKEGILGAMGIGEHNANMVNYMVSTGMSFAKIDEKIRDNADFMQSLKENTRYDSENSFYDPTEEWGAKKPEMVAFYKKGLEFGTMANAILNRDLPNTPQDMYAYKQKVEGFVNRSYKAAGMNRSIKFDMLKFIADDNYAKQHTDIYQKLLTGKTKDNHGINILNVLANSPHIRSYMQLYGMSVDILMRKSNISRVSFGIANARGTVDANAYRSINEFVYGVAVERFMQDATSSNGKYDLSTIDGRNAFTSYMGNTRIGGFLKSIQAKPEYANNPFVQGGMFVDNVPRHKYNDAPQLRTFDINNLEEQKLLVLQAGFDSLNDQDRNDLVSYNLITRKGAMGKGSVAQLFNNADTSDFNSFLKGFDVEVIADAARKYNDYRINKAKTNNHHNSIPYSMTEEVRKSEVKKTPSDPLSKADPKGKIPSNYIGMINNIITNLNALGRVETKGRAATFRPIPEGALSGSTYEFFSNQPAMTVAELVQFALGSKFIKSGQKSRLENTYRGMAKVGMTKASDNEIVDRIRKCKA